MLKLAFKVPDVATYWRKAGLEYLPLSDRSDEVLNEFAITYRCEGGFSPVVNTKSKARSKKETRYWL
jgi:hypothetical protein